MMKTTQQRFREAIRNVPDFPKPGINFKDITPVFQVPELVRDVVSELASQYKTANIEGIAGIESRGFLIGVPLALALNVPFILIRKRGKLPYETVSHKYHLEYGTAEIEMHIDAVEPDQNILIHDDLLATGGSAAAAAELIISQKASVVGFDFLIELDFLNGREQLVKYSKNISNFVTY
ncbi:MAG: adenine phosphoribosyltransferase [Putridiphycobacter sp.]|nr:adenine phosphoribosyltransferase [Putridiphycobacter sp.]